MAITEINPNERCPPPNSNIAEAELKCDTPCKRALSKVQDKMDKIKNNYTVNSGERREGVSTLPDIQGKAFGTYLNPQQYRSINKAINNAYGNLAKDLPNLPWPKVAHVVSSQFGCNMDNFMAGGWARYNPAGNYVGDDDAAVTIGEGVIRIFQNMYLPMRIIADIGPEEFLKCVKSGEIKANDKMIKAAEAMVKGNYITADKLIVDFEQDDVASTLYKDFSKQYKYIAKVASKTRLDALGGWGRNFESVPPTIECGMFGGTFQHRVPFNGDLTNVTDRINFYDHFKKEVLENYK